MSKHIHAELMMQYAQDAMETGEPWERWEFYGKISESWMSVKAGVSPAWWPDVQYRRKPKPYEPTLLDQALELEIEAAKLRLQAMHVAQCISDIERLNVRICNHEAQRSQAMIEHLKSQGKL